MADQQTMKKFFQSITLTKTLQFFVSLFVFLLPWQTIYIYREQIFNGEKFQYGTLGWYGFEIILWLAIGVFMVWYLRKRKEKNINSKFSWSADRKFVLYLLFLILLTLASTLWSLDKEVAQQHSFHILEASLLFFILFIGPIDVKKTLQWFIAGATLQSVLAMYQFLTQSTFAWKWFGLVSHPVFQTGTSVIQSGEAGRWLRAYGAFPHPNMLGGYLAISIFFTLFLFLSDKRKKIPSQFWWYILFGVQVVALFFTFSRSAWFALILGGIGLIHWNWKRCAKLAVFLGAIMTVLSFLYFPLLKTRTVAESPHETRSLEERKEGPHLAYTLWKESWFLGVGAGNYTQALTHRFPNISPALVQPVHVVPLLFLTELGVLGMVFLFGALFFFWRANTWKKGIASGMLLLPLLFFDHYLYSFAGGLLLLAFFCALSTRYLSTVYPQ